MGPQIHLRSPARLSVCRVCVRERVLCTCVDASVRACVRACVCVRTCLSECVRVSVSVSVRVCL